MLTKERSAEIRKRLKAQGITSRQVSVRTDTYSLGSSIYITIKDAKITETLVDEIAREHEKIDRCFASGEILSGGNRFVFIDYDNDLVRQEGEKLLETAEKAKAELAELSHGTGVEFGDTGLLLFKANGGHGYQIRHKERHLKGATQTMEEARWIAQAAALILMKEGMMK
jgi:hypothetical protein